MISMVAIVMLVLAIPLIWAYGEVSERAVTRWAEAHAVTLTADDRGVVRSAMRTARLLRTWGALGGVVLGRIVPLALGFEVRGFGWLTLLLGYLAGTACAKLSPVPRVAAGGRIGVVGPGLPRPGLRGRLERRSFHLGSPGPLHTDQNHMATLAVDPPPDLPSGRVIRRFVVSQVVLVALFGTLWWSALVTPRLSLGSASSGSHDPVTGRTTAEVHLRNSSPFAVTIRGAALPDTDLTLDSVHLNGVDAALGGLRLEAGAEATIVIEFTCRPTNGDGRHFGTQAPPTWTGVGISAETALGLERSRSAGTVPLFTECVS